MEIKKIVEGMTAPQVAKVIEDNFNEAEKEKADKTELSVLGSKVNNVAINSFEKAVPTVIINGYYINNTGKWVSQSGQNLFCWEIKKNEVVILKGNYNSVYADYSIFSELPSVNDTPIYYGGSPLGSYRMVVSQYDGYICIGGVNDCEMFRGTTLSANTKKVRLSAFVDSIVRCSILDGISKKPTGVIDGYYIDKNGVFVSASAQKTCYYEAKKGDVVKISAAHNINYASWAFYKEQPTVGAVPLEFVPFNNEQDHYFVVNDDGFVATSYSPNYGKLEYVIADTSKNLFQTIIDKFNDVEKADKGVFFYERTDFDLTIMGYYINGQGSWTQQGGQMTRCWRVSKGEKYKTLSGTNYPYFSAWAFFENEPKVGDKPYSFAQWVTDADSFVTAPIDGYIAVSNYPTAKLYSGQDYLIFNNSYENKTCLYIGDSISTGNIYHWKGFLEENYKLKWARDKSGVIAPANSGITIIPKEVEPENDANKSIWHRCANARMSAYEFDMISLFGGTNDMTDENLVIGTENDVPFVDDVSTFTNGENVTDVRPETLTFASALIGCILMLRRDFPNKEIILPTVMPCGLSYGNWTDSVTGLRASEAIANLQLRIAEKFDLKAIPLYWDMRTSKNAANNWCDQYGVHPNKQGARRMQAIMAQTLCLK